MSKCMCPYRICVRYLNFIFYLFLSSLSDKIFDIVLDTQLSSYLLKILHPLNNLRSTKNKTILSEYKYYFVN